MHFGSDMHCKRIPEQNSCLALHLKRRPTVVDIDNTEVLNSLIYFEKRQKNCFYFYSGTN